MKLGPYTKEFKDNIIRLHCSLRRLAVADAFANGRPALANGR